MKDKIIKRGYVPIAPFDVCNEKDKPYSYYMGKDIEALLECDYIYFVDGWEKSKGCCAEKAIADIYGINRIYIYTEPKSEPQFEIGELVMMRDSDEHLWEPKHFANKMSYEKMDYCYRATCGNVYRQCAKFDKDIVFTNKPANK